MRSKYTWIFVVLLTLAFGVLGFSVGRLAAAPGTLDSPGPPESTLSYTLEDIYNRLDTGAAGTQSTFTEPSLGPTSGTGHTLDEIYDLIGLRAPVPKTGQTTSYRPGDDGHLEKGVAWPTPRFTDNGDGTVTDNLTGLIWLKNANCFGTRTWTQALSDAHTLNSGECGLSDGSSAGEWRLPNVRELQSLIDYGRWDPALPSGHPFTGVQSNFYWSSTTVAYDASYAWYVYLVVGFGSSVGFKANSFYVWPVRGGQ